MRKEGKNRIRQILQIKKILYTTDLSENSAYAFYYAADMAKKNEAKIVILHVIEPLTTFLMASEAFVEEIRERIQKLRQRVDRIIGTSSDEFVSKVLIRIGRPSEEILRTIDEEGCDVIIIGSHGKESLTQSFFGNVSSSILHRAHKLVFIVPLPSKKNTTSLI